MWSSSTLGEVGEGGGSTCTWYVAFLDPFYGRAVMSRDFEDL